MAIQIIQAGKATVMVERVDRAIRFYTDVLGLSLRRRSGDDYAEVEAPGLTVALIASDRPSVRTGPVPVQCSIGFDVERLEGAMLVLRGRGVLFAAEIAEGERERIAYFTDEDGTPLYLREVKP